MNSFTNVIMITIFLVSSAQGQSTKGVKAYSIFVDEDLWQHFGRITDQNYTMGFGLKYADHALSSSKFSAGVTVLRDRVGLLFRPETAYFPKKYDSVLTSRSGFIALSGNGFTPKNLNTSVIQYDDRPYASLVVLTYGVGRLYLRQAARPQFYSTEISFGVIGSGASSQLQTWIHQMMNNHDTESPYTPKGWGHQISNGGEPTIMILNRSRTLLYSIRLNPFNNRACETDDAKFKALRMLDLTFSKESFAGYYTGAALSLGGRFGILDFRNWLSTIFPLQGVAQAAGTANLAASTRSNIRERIYKKRRGFELYVSSEIKPTLMVYNALLQGQFRHSDYTISGNNTNPFNFVFNNAFVFNLPIGPLNINAVYNFYAYKSSEFRRTSDYHGRGHTWGGGYLTVAYYPNWTKSQ